MSDLDRQTRRIILLRGALELIANSSDIAFTKSWAQMALKRDLESRLTTRAPDLKRAARKSKKSTKLSVSSG